MFDIHRGANLNTIPGLALFLSYNYAKTRAGARSATIYFFPCDLHYRDEHRNEHDGHHATCERFPQRILFGA